MNKEPLAVTTLMRFVLNGLVQGLILFDVVTLTTGQHAWLTVTLAGMIEAVLWLITRNEVWAPAGSPTHPPTEELWSSKLAATKAEYEQLFSAPGHSGAGAQLSQETQEALVDDVNSAAV